MPNNKKPAQEKVSVNVTTTDRHLARPTSSPRNKKNTKKKQLIRTPTPRGSPSMSSPVRAAYEQSLTNVMSFLTDPFDSPVIRMASGYSVEPTATAKLFDRVSSIVPAATATTGITPSGAFFAAMFRDPCRSLVFSDPNTLENEYAYAMSFMLASNDAGNEEALPNTTQDVSCPNAEVYNIMFAYGTPASGVTYEPHGGIMWAGEDRVRNPGKTYIWLDKGAELYIEWTGNDGIAATLRAYMWRPSEDAYFGSTPVPPMKSKLIPSKPGKVLDIDHDNTQDNNNVIKSNKRLERRRRAHPRAAGNVTFTASESGYHRFEWLPASGAAEWTGMSIEIAGAGPVTCHRGLPYYGNNAGSSEEIRILSAALLFTNTASPLDRSGSISICQSPGAIVFTEYLESKRVQNVSGSYTGQLALGCYGWLRPTGEDDFKFKVNLACTSSGAVVRSFFPIVSPSSYLIMYGSTKETDFSSMLTVTHAIEYKTDDIWREKRRAETSIDVFRRALEASADLAQFHENPLHIKRLLSQITGTARKIMGGVNRYMPLVNEGLGLIDKFAAL